MIASLKAYKGTREFVELAVRMPEYRFILVLNETQENINSFLKSIHGKAIKGTNLKIYPRQSDTTPFT